MKKILFLSVLLFIAPNLKLQCQDFSNSSLKVGIGIGINEGLKETGMGTLVTLGYQKSLWKDRLRIGPSFLTGGFFPFLVTDVRDQYVRITSIGFNGYLDALKFKPVSIFLASGAFVNYSRGLLGTGGWYDSGNNHSEYFFKAYYGGYLGGGIRVNPPKSRIVYEFTPINICFGNDYFLLSYFKIGIDIKLNKRE